MYYSQDFDDYEEFAESYPEVAAALLEDVGEGKWQEYYIYVYDSVEDFAEYELTEGWYADFGLGDRDYNGAPDPMDYIDLKALGEALLDSGDSSVQWTNGDVVVTTSYGW